MAKKGEEKKKKLLEALDYNKNGKIDVEDIIVLGLKTPGVKINRESFLKKEFQTICSKEKIDDIIKTSPKAAGINEKTIEKIADEVVKRERTCVSGISTVLSMPGGFAMLATVPADLIQYYGYLLRAAQELLYLYGFEQINFENEEDGLDSTTINAIIVCLGVMYGVNGANKALIAISKALATGVEKKLLAAALTKGTIYPLVKQIAKWFGVRMTKVIFAGAIKKAIPFVGAALGFATTFFTFKPCCENLRKTLRETYLYNPDREHEKDELVIDVEVADANK